MDNKAQNAQNTYQTTQISTATKEQLLLITYDIGIRSCRIAETALEGTSPNFDLANKEIIRAQEVIRELMVTLNTEKGGEAAQGLLKLYDYMYQLLVDANIKKEPHNVATVRGMLEELKATWEEALLKLLKEYQAAHPDDEDFQDISKMQVSSLTESLKAAPTAAAAKPLPQAEKPKAGGLNIAG